MRAQFVILLILFSAVSAPAVYGQSDSKQVSVQTSVSTYYEGDVLIIGGSVNKIVTGTPITIQVFREDNSVVDIAQIDVALDGSFTHTMITSGPQWTSSGKYRIDAKYGDSIDVTEFQFIKSEERGETSSNYEVDAGNSGTFDVRYTIRGATVDEMVVDTYGLSLLVFIESSGTGEITMDIPSEYVDAQDTDGNSVDFIVLVDNVQVAHMEIDSDPGNRKITVPFSTDSEEIRIIGTHAIPEFGAIGLLVLAAAVASVIVVSLRSSYLKPVF